MSEIAGYVVAGANGVYLVGFYDDGPKRGLLLLGKHCTLFESRRAAKAAIARTARYASSHMLSWGVEKYRVTAVRRPND